MADRRSRVCSPRSRFPATRQGPANLLRQLLPRWRLVSRARHLPSSCPHLFGRHASIGRSLRYSSWLNARDITKLSKDDISSFLSAGHRKASGGLKEAYETAADPEEWIAAQEELLRSREEDEREAAENVDELEDEDETPAGGKRKRGAASKPAQKKKAKKVSF